MFSNQSFITDKAMYNSQTGEVTSLNGSDISDDYIDTVSKIVKISSRFRSYCFKRLLQAPYALSEPKA